VAAFFAIGPFTGERRELKAQEILEQIEKGCEKRLALKEKYSR